MPKRIDNIFYDKLKFKTMLNAYYRASKGKKNCKEVITYELDLANNITQTLKQLYNGTYNVGKYRQFKIYEPKQRIIEALPFRDRVVQQWYIEEFIKPIFVPKLIKDTYACLENRGVHLAVKNLNKYIYNYSRENEDMYILKCDVYKFFYSIDKVKLYKIIERKVKDKNFLNLTKKLIKNNNNPIGIPIGNYTSQYFANIYLNELDHFIKEKLHIKYYVRYMDDFVLLLKDKENAKEVLIQIKKYLKENLGLELNQKTNYFKLKQGVVFCGYKIYKECILLKKDNKKKIYKKVKEWNKLYEKNQLNFKKASIKLNSWIGHAKNADSYILIEKIKNNSKWIYNENSYNL